MTSKMNVESFNLDHTKVKAPYVRLADKKMGFKWKSQKNQRSKTTPE